ncbi:MAG: ribonuclease HII [Chitinophagales bacterium]|nr:ribonuclease HII [Chitinophagales bacterium]
MLRKFYQKEVLEAGVDEAGRGCLAGPVFAAAVILDPSRRIPGINDSKKLNPEKRHTLRKKIESRALAYAVAQVSPIKIDEVNILNASFLAMHRAILELNVKPAMILVDGNRFNPLDGFSFKCIIKGDSKLQSIAAASILAKTYRDDYMETKHLDHPEYCWDSNKGYPTRAHRNAIAEFGITDLHRKTFQLLPSEQLSIF